MKGCWLSDTGALGAGQRRGWTVAGGLVLCTLALAGWLGAPPAAQAQAGAGRVAGRVLSAETREPVSAAQVTVPGTSRGALTDATGRFLLVGVPAGTREVLVQSLGYSPRTVTGVRVEEAQVTALEIVLEPRAVALEGVTVAARRERGSNTSLLTERRAAAVVVDALGAEQIARSADGDAASALKRVPGVSVVGGKFVYVRGLGERYGATTLNGAPLPSPIPDRKAVPLDLIPSGMLESVVTAKTYSPDQPGDYAGGLVQLETRSYPTSPFLKFSTSVGLEAGTSLATGLGYSGGRLDWLGVEDGARSLPAALSPDRPAGLPADAATAAELARFASAHWAPREEKVPVNRGFAATFGNQVEVAGRPLGFITSGTYSRSHATTDDLVERFYAFGGGPALQVDYSGRSTTHSVALGGLLNAGYRLRGDDEISLSVLFNRLVDDQAREIGGLFESQGPYIRAPRLQYVSNDLLSAQLRAEHALASGDAATLRWRAGYSRAGRYEPDTRTVVYRAGEAEGPFEFFAGPSSGLIFHQDLVDHALNAAADLRLSLAGAARGASLALGGSAETRDRGVYSRRFRLVPVAGELRPGDLGLPPEELFAAERIGSQVDLIESTFREDNYDAGHSVVAGYGMLDLEPLPGVRLVAGARLEHAKQHLQVIDLLGTSADAPPAARLDNTDVLPALNLSLGLAERSSLRLALSRTVARPQFRELAPYLFADYYGGVVSRGNPFVERGRIVNADVRWEWFFRSGAVISASAFRKEFERPIEPFAFLLGSSPAQTWVNTDAAWLNGAELELRTDLGMLAPALENVLVNANLTLARSGVSGETVSIYDPDTGRPLEVQASGYHDRPLFGQSPYVINAGLTYRLPATGGAATLLFNRFGRRLDAFGGQLLPDIYERGRSQLDVVIDHPLGHGVHGKLAAGGLLGDRVEFLQTFPDGETVVTRSYRTGRTLSLSLSWEPGNR